MFDKSPTIVSKEVKVKVFEVQCIGALLLHVPEWCVSITFYNIIC